MSMFDKPVLRTDPNRSAALMARQAVSPSQGSPDLAAVSSRTLPSGFGAYHIYDGPRGDVPGGPTEQPGVMPGHGYEALRTPFGATGIPGQGRERNLTDLRLANNHHPDGLPYAAPNGRSTLRVPDAPRLRRDEGLKGSNGA